jgi:hypothetical protein
MIGLNIITSPEWLRLQLDWQHIRSRPDTGEPDACIVQLIATF